MKSVWVKFLVACVVLMAAACTDARDESAQPEGTDDVSETDSDTGADSGDSSVETEPEDEAGADTTQATSPYCQALPADLVAFVNDPAGLNPGDPQAAEASFRAVAAASTELVDLAPAEVSDDAILRREVADAYVAALESVGWDLDALGSDAGAVALLDETIGRADHQASLRTLADHDEALCQLRRYPADEEWPATEAADVADGFLNPYNVVAGFTGADTELMRSATEPGSPAAGYAEFRDATLEFIPEAEGAFRPIVDGDEILACNGSICARYSNFSLADSGLVDNYVINGLALDRAVVKPLAEPVANDGVTVESVVGYINTADQLQLVVEMTGSDQALDLDVLATTYIAGGVGVDGSAEPTTLQTSVPDEVSVSADGSTRALLIFRPKVRLPGTVTLVFDGGPEIQIALESMADRR